MKKFLSLVLLMVLMTPFALRADEVIIGYGTSSSRDVPFQNYYSHGYTELIYQASEMGSAGIINSVSFFCATPDKGQYMQELRIYMGETTKSVYSHNKDWTPTSDLTMVYEATNFDIGFVDGWYTFELDTPFLYEGNNNLVVVVAKKGVGYNGSLKWNYTNVPNTVMTRRSDWNGDQFLVHPGSNTGSVMSTRSNVRFDITPMTIDCFKVLSVQGVDATQTTATITWEPYPGQAAWDVYVSLDGNAPDANTAPNATITETHYTFEGLNPNTDYNFYVRANCGESVSAWKCITYRTGPDLSGSGTEEDPYKIYSAADLKMLTDVMKLGFNTTGKHFLQMNDIDGVNFCVGDGAITPFKGTYDGNGYYVDIDLYGDYDQGFFKTLGHGAVVKNLTITGEAETRYWQTGGVVAVIELSSSTEEGYIYIDNCVNRATITSKGNNVGGIISDFNANDGTYLVITNCANYGEISAPSNTAYAGGIGGRFQRNAIVNNCVNHGEITGLGYVGGIVAYPRTNVVIANSVNKGNINGTGDRIGGISGYSSGGSIINSYNLGTVKGTNYLGGIIGRLKGGSEGQGVLQNVYNAGQVISATNDTEKTGAVLGVNEGDYAAVTYAYYLEGVYGQAYGTTAKTEIISNVSSFTQDVEIQTNFVLANEIAGTTDLLTALNTYDVEDCNEWFLDTYGNNGYYPTFVVGNPPGIEFVPSPFAIGARPIGSEMHAEKVEMKNTGSVPIEVTLLDLENTSFMILDEDSPNPEFPITIEPDNSVDIYVTTKTDADIEEGDYSTSVVAMWNKMSRLASVGQIMATAYVPTTPDVVETSQLVDAFPFNATVNTSTVYNNYRLPGDKPDANDVVYEINVTEDVLLNASVDGANNKIAVYTEDFYGGKFPDRDNNYVGIPIENESELDFFYFNQAEMVTHPGEGIHGSDLSQAFYYYGANVNKQWYQAADDFHCDENISINEMEFYAYQTGSSTDQSTITGLYVEIYDDNPMEGGEVIWGSMDENIMSYSNWTGIYRVDMYTEYNRPIMRVVATDLDIELPAGTYWVSVGMTGSLSDGPYAVQRTISGSGGNTGNALLCNQGEWSEWNDNGSQPGLSMIIKANTTIRDIDVVRTTQMPYTGEVSAMMDEISEQSKSMFDNNRNEASVYGGDDAIENAVLTPGKYYIVASSTSAEFTVEMNTETIPLPEQAILVAPEDKAKNITAPLDLRWTLGQYTTEYQVLFGGTYPPTEVLIDWTSNLANGYTLVDLNNNINYFWQVNERNASGVTEGPIWAFTTTFNVPYGVTVEDSKLYPGESAVLSWTPIQERAHSGYNIYQNGVKINNVPVTEPTYTVEGLGYNMEGYVFEVTAKFDEGESEKSAPVTVYVTGNGIVEGFTYEQDGVTPIACVNVKFAGFDEFNMPTVVTFTSDDNGYYTGELLAGVYSAETTVKNYQNAVAVDIEVEYDKTTSDVNFSIYENFNPVYQVKADAMSDTSVNVYWSWNAMIPESMGDDFETGDFTANAWNNEVSDYPFVITEEAYDGSYAMKSSCEGVDDGVSAIEIQVEVPYNGLVSFYHKVSSEQTYDVAYFYIDGNQMASVSGEMNWTYKELAITEGTHTLRWEYAKDYSMTAGNDAYYVDNVTFYKEKEPFIGGWIHYDDGMYASSIGTGSQSPCYWGISFPTTEEYAGYTISKVAVYDAAPDYAGTYTANIYVGGTTVPSTLVSSQEVTLTGIADFVEIELSTPVAIDGTQPLWITFYTPNVTYPAAGCAFVGDANSDWISLDGTTWSHAYADYNLAYSWMIRAYLENAKGETIALAKASEAPKFKGGVSTGTFAAAENVIPRFAGLPERIMHGNNVGMNRALQSYKIYRVNNLTDEYTEETVELVASEVMDTTYIDANFVTLEDGVYKWGIAAVYEGNRDYAVNNAKSFLPEAGFVPRPNETLPYDGNTRVANFDSSLLRGDMAYANNVFPMEMAEGYVAFDIENPLAAVAVNEVVVNRAGEYFNGVFYGYDSNNNFYKINPTTGDIISQTTVSTTLTEMAYDYSSNTMYGISDGVLYTVNLENGGVSMVGNIGQTIMAFGINLDGEAYGIALATGDLYAINLEDASSTLVGATGVGCNYIQSAGFNHNDGTFYWFQCYSANNMGLYTVDVTTALATLVAPNIGEVTSWFIPYEYNANDAISYPFQDFNESPIVWSNTVDKGMVTSVEVITTTNSGDAPTGAVVELVNLSEEGMGYDYTAILDESGMYTWEQFRKGTYMLTISLPGFVSNVEGEIIEIWDATTIECILEEITAVVGDLYVSPTGWAMWNRTAGETGDEFEFNFDTDGQGWTIIDADGDGHNWCHSTSLEAEYSATPEQSLSGHMLSGSYHWDFGALTPDNYLISPKMFNIGTQSTLTFRASAQDQSYPTEHFGIAISTTTNTSADDFTIIWEETMIAKGNVKTVNDDERGYGTWYEYSVDLGQYAGQKVYIAFRHFDTYNQFFLRLDDVKLVNATDRALTSYTIMLNGNVEAEVAAPYYQHENLIVGEQYTTSVVANYTTGSSEPMTYTWNYTKCDNFEGTTEFTAEYVDGNAVLNWTLPGSTPTPDQENLAYSFDEGFDGWTTIDGNNDGHIWYHSTECEMSHNVLPGEPHSGAGHLCSESFCNALGALFPDDYLVSPEKIAVATGTKLSFWAAAQDESWAAEHFGVAVSTSGNTSTSDFTTIAEWTIGGKTDKQGERGLRQTAWVQYEVDLSDYAGQEVWVAIRHFNVSDMFILMVDDVEITTASKEAKDGTWMYYDNGEIRDGIGGPTTFYWGIKLRAEDLAAEAPTALTKVSMYDRVATSGTLYIYKGGDNAPGEMVHSQAYTCTAANDFVEYELTTAVDVDGIENIWIVFETNEGHLYPASCCDNTGDADGRWISMDNVAWMDVLTGAGLDVTWMIRAYLGEGGGEDVEDEIDLLGVMLYRDGELLTTEPLTSTSYTEPLTEVGEYEYCLRVVHGGAKDTTYYAMSCPECITVTAEMMCDAPEDLYAEQAEVDGVAGVSLLWPYSEPMSEWLYYDNGNNEDGIGGPSSFYWGVMFPAESLAAYAGTSITKVSMFDFAASSGDINIYYGGTTAPGDMIHTQSYTVAGTGQFVEFDLTAALPIDPTMNVWVVFSTTQGTNYPAAVCSNTGDPNGRWISMDGVEWGDLTDYGLSKTWMIRALVSNYKGEVSSLSPITDYEYTASEGEVKAAGLAKGRALNHYNVYRGTSANDFELVGETNEGTYFDELTESGTYYYQVTAVYVENGEECESDPANAYNDADQDYVVVDFVSVNENGVNGMMIYPNPTKADLNINVETMIRITITNTLGQIMYDKEVDTDNEVIDMAQYEAGVYMVRLVTENGVAVERVTVVK